MQIVLWFVTFGNTFCFVCLYVNLKFIGLAPNESLIVARVSEKFVAVLQDRETGFPTTIVLLFFKRNSFFKPLLSTKIYALEKLV